MMNVIKDILLGAKDALIDVLLFPLVLLRAIGRGIRLGVRSILRSPIGAYRKLITGRDWLLAKIEYLQSESQKWATLFNIVRSPYKLLLGLGFSPAQAAAVLMASTAVGGGVVVNETILSERSFSNADSGRYAAPHDVPVYWAEGFNTLLVSLSTTSVDKIGVASTSLGTIYTGSAIPSPATTVVDIGGSVAANSWIEAGKVTLDGLRCRQLLVQNVAAHTLNIKNNTADGISIAPSPGSGASNRPRNIIAGNHGSDEMLSRGGTFDRFVIESLTTNSTAYVSEIHLEDILTRGATCRIQRMRVGELNIINSIIGNGDGLAAKDLLIATSVTAQVVNVEQNTEVLTAEPGQINN